MDTSGFTEDNARDFFEAFVRSLIDRQYSEARALLGEETAADWTTEKLAVAWVQMVISDGPIVLFPDTMAVDTMDDATDRHTSDVAWVYAAIANDAVNEGLSGIVFEGHHGLKIRDLAFGRNA